MQVSMVERATLVSSLGCWVLSEQRRWAGLLLTISAYSILKLNVRKVLDPSKCPGLTAWCVCLLEEGVTETASSPLLQSLEILHREA